MPADLTTASLVARQSVVLDDEAMILLESRGSSSRVRRVPYRQVYRLTLHRRWPAGRMATIFLALLLPGAAIALIDEPIARGFAAVLIVLAVCILSWYGVCRKTMLRFEFGSMSREVEVIATPARLDRFVRRFTELVTNVQAARRVELETRLGTASSEG
ncbi:MAG: hypothetical protein AAGH92_00225 [Planctomycetota bacterium]